MVPDASVFSSMKNEQQYPCLYDSVVHQGYLCKFCELFCGHSSSSQELFTVGINLGTVSSQLKVANKKFSWHKLFLYLIL
jgi:hypothetical protein